MEKPKRWHQFLIIACITLTIYNILPTVFFYTKPLKQPIDAEKALVISQQIASRVNNLEEDALAWIRSFCKLLKIKPVAISPDPTAMQFVKVSFRTTEDMQRFQHLLPKAGSLIGFAPSQLSIYDVDSDNKIISVQRKISVHFDHNQMEQYFQFGSKKNRDGSISPLYENLVKDRAIQIAVALAGASENAQIIQASIQNIDHPQSQDLLILSAQNLIDFLKIFDPSSAIAKRYFASFSQAEGVEPAQFVPQYIAALEKVRDAIRLEKIALNKEQNALQAENQYLTEIKKQRLELTQTQEVLLSSCIDTVKKYSSEFSASKTPWNYATAASHFNDNSISLAGFNPFIEKIVIDWNSGKIVLAPYSDILEIRANTELSLQKDRADQLIYNEIATAARWAAETIEPFNLQFSVSLSNLPDSSGFLALRLYSIADAEVKQIKTLIADQWHPIHTDLTSAAFPIWDEQTYQHLPKDEQQFGLLIYAPSMQNKMPPKGLKMNSIYIIAKGVDAILQRFEGNGNSVAAKQFLEDFNQLRMLLQKNGFFGYSGNSFAVAGEFKNDFIFENEDYFLPLLKATREDFHVRGTKRYAVLELSNVEQRILVENKIGTQIHEDLLKWRDDYYAAQVNLHGMSQYDVPAPTQNTFISNLKLSTKKYFRGDERKIIHWGLDMSGGKTVQIELRDSNGRIVSSEAEIRQGINELYNRVNKMGVAEVNIRQEGNSIVLDFPGSQSLSATELVKASSMYFHVVNEKFMMNPALAEATTRFLQEVWNEALVTNHKNPDEIQLIAWRHLHGDTINPAVVQPRSPAAKLLYEQGLRLTNPQEPNIDSMFNDTYSKIAVLRGNDFTSWQGQTNPLMIVFSNYALEGSSLENVHASYDPAKGNFLSFSVKNSQSTKEGVKWRPRDDLEAWTTHFSKEKIIGTPLSEFSQGRGWRMAVILNGTVITSPALESALRDSASITGSFTQREINQLEADLKAGSLSFTPRILSEKNVSPELGSSERLHGVISTVAALSLIFIAMIGYYRFGGMVACGAVICNLLIIWAIFQNIGATLTLANIAGLVLTIAMAVDANVLVFERIREEFSISPRITAAIHAGYRKAFSAIIDSNITTLIAALVLFNFDSGPIRGFAITLIIGIASSMFTALFMTRFFFSYWVRNPEHKELKMSHWIQASSFNFLKWTKPTIVVSAVVIMLGAYLITISRNTILGMDFTGGYALSIEIPVSPSTNYRQIVEKALLQGGARSQDFQVRELNPNNQIRIFLSRSLEQPGKPFAGMPLQNEFQDLPYAYENNPRIVWIVDSLYQVGIQLSPDVMNTLDQNWSSVSGQMSDTMRTNALIGLVIALLCILAYITIRFEFKYAVAATLCLFHDVVFSIGAIAILHKLGTPIQIDLHTVAALMTIVGYSLNDTIIIFDRIREDVRRLGTRDLSAVINHALNVTLSRTLLTSGITLLVLLPLIVLGGSTLFGFSLVMAIGVVFGTLSSLFVAAPLMQYFHNREQKKVEPYIAHDA